MHVTVVGLHRAEWLSVCDVPLDICLCDVQLYRRAMLLICLLS